MGSDTPYSPVTAMDGSLPEGDTIRLKMRWILHICMKGRRVSDYTQIQGTWHVVANTTEYMAGTANIFWCHSYVLRTAYLESESRTPVSMIRKPLSDGYHSEEPHTESNKVQESK